jgi:tripartite-type tricarboxylate transporter receptor subunit TctC
VSAMCHVSNVATTSLVVALFVLWLPAAGRAQSHPDRSIKVMVPFPAGGSTDTVARVVTQDLDVDLGQSVVIENVSGAGGFVGCKVVVRSAPDGYTLLLGGTSSTITPALYKDLDDDPVNDFAPVAAIATDTEVLVVHPSVPATTLAEFVRYAVSFPLVQPSASHATLCSNCFAYAAAPTWYSFHTRAPRPPSRTCWAARSRSA